MKAGQFNIYEYLERLNENAETGNLSSKDTEGLIIPDENKKSYDWLKKEYNAKQTEVKVEITGSGASFKPGYDLQASNDSVKDFKPGMFGEAKPAKDGDAKTDEKKPNLDAKKDTGSFTKGEGDKQKSNLPKTNAPKKDIKDKEEGKENDEKDEEDKEEKKDKPEVKKIDLKTKKKDDTE